MITYCTGTDLLRALYDSIEHVTVLDPTCGSGAFLFSALGILEGFYEACLERMQDLVEEREVLDAVEIKMLVEGTNLPPIKPLPSKNDDGVQQVIKPEPGRTPVKGGERPATA